MCKGPPLKWASNFFIHAHNMSRSYQETTSCQNNNPSDWSCLTFINERTTILMETLIVMSLVQIPTHCVWNVNNQGTGMWCHVDAFNNIQKLEEIKIPSSQILFWICLFNQQHRARKQRLRSSYVHYKQSSIIIVLWYTLVWNNSRIFHS